MFKKKLGSLLCVTAIVIWLTTAGGSAIAESTVFTVVQVNQASTLRDAALKDTLAFALVDSLVTEVGARPAGSANDQRAVNWALDKLRGLGFSNVRAEPVAMRAWKQGPVSMDIVAPFPQRLVVTALGNSVGTPDGGLQAELVYYANFDALKADTTERAKGKLVFIDQKTERTKDGHGYGNAVLARFAGAVEAARRGAVAVAIRSIGTDRDRIAHTGGMRYDAQLRQIPSLAVSVPDAELISRMQRYNQPIQINLQLQAEGGIAATSHNVIAEIPGTDLKDEVVAIGAHLDSWHVGQGAIDDGAGVSIVVAAAKQILDQGLPLRRTLRVVLFANEENGIDGATSYADRYKPVRHQLVGESDLGAGKVWRMRSKVTQQALPALREMGAALQPLGIEVGGNDGTPAPDAGVLVRRNGWPGIELSQDGSDYFDWHHTDNDTLDKIDPAMLPGNVAAWAVVAWMAAQSPLSFSAP